MNNFFKDIFQGDKKKNEGGQKLGGGGGGGGPKMQNPFANLGQKKFQGSGQSLGGAKAGKIIRIELSDPGTLGLKVERRPNSHTAIVSMVVAGSQAETAGLVRGDILCFEGSNGQSEIQYKDFLTMAKSGQRPVVFEIRRVQTKAPIAADTRSADALAKKQAVIAAAEAREKAHKKKQKPIAKGEKRLPDLLSTAEKRQQDLERARDAQLKQQEEPRSEEARRAMEAAKRSEAQLASQLGYNPYEASSANAGQARNATVTAQQGPVGGGGGGAKAKSEPDSIPSVRPPSDPTKATEEQSTDDAKILSNCPGFYDTYTTVVTVNTNNDAVVKSFGIMRTLVKNATTKGQNTENGEESAGKFRRVRLSNAKIKAAILDVTGALELMMLFGFQLVEEDGENFLVFPLGPCADFLPAAMRQMERYEKS